MNLTPEQEDMIRNIFATLKAKGIPKQQTKELLLLIWRDGHEAAEKTILEWIKSREER